MRAVATPSVVVLALAWSFPAFAGAAADRCVDTNAKAQLLRRSGKLAAARDELRSCAEARCPTIVRNDCTQRLDELARVQPTIVFDAKDAGGNDLVAVTVTVDGQRLTDKLDGSPLDVDPGPHTFAFEVPDQPPVTRTLVVKEGEKARVEHVVLGPGSPPRVAASPPAGAAPPAPRPIDGPPAGPGQEQRDGTWSPGKVVGVVAGALGVGSIAAGAVFGLFAQSAWNRSSAACNAASCPEKTRPQAQADRQTAVTDGALSTAGFVAGGALVAGGLALFVAFPSSPEHAQRTGGLRLAPVLEPHAVGLQLRADF